MKNICLSKKVAISALSLLLLILFIFPQTAKATSDKVMRVGWFAQDGYQEMTDEGKPYGFNYEYLMNISQYTDWKYEFVKTNSFAECYNLLKDGKIDIMGYITYSDERAKEISFPQLNTGYAASSLFVKDESEIAPYDFEAFNGMRVACMESKNPETLQTYAMKNNFSVELVYYNDSQAIKAAVQSGEVDSGLLAGYQTEDHSRIVASFAPKPFYFAVKKYDTQSLAKLNNALEMLKMENPMLDRDLSYKYLPEIRNSLHLTQAEKRYIKNRSDIKVKYKPNWFPISMKNSQSGELNGIVADVCSRISDLTGLQFKYIADKDVKPTDNITIDANSLSQLSSFSDDGMRLTNAYLNVPLVLIQKSEPPEKLINKTAMMHELYKNFDVYAMTDNQVVCYDSFDRCMKAVLDGEVDKAIVNAYASEQFLQQTKYRSLQSSVLYNRSYDLSFGITPDEDPILLSILNKSLSVISASDMSVIINQNIAKSFDISLSTIVAYMPSDVAIIICVALLIMLFLGALVIWKQFRHSENIKKMLYTDELTGVLSIKGFEIQAKNRLHKTDANAFIVDFDINHFGDFNSIHGYQSGDELLRNIATVLQESFKSNELCARVQADRFVCLIFADTVNEVIERINKDSKTLCDITKILFLLFTYGIYPIVDKSLDISTMCDCALLAKRSVKGNYNRNIAVYDEILHKRQLSNTDLLDNFEEALQAGEFVHYYQPKFDAKTKELVGAEALVRWIHNDTLIMPGQFIDLFETNGLIAKLDLHMFDCLCEKLHFALQHKLHIPPISINFSRVHLFDEDFSKRLATTIENYNIPADLIEIEITETAFSEGYSAMVKTIEQLHEVGFLVSIDDFGSGFSSLNTLKDVDFDIIKVDRGFLSNADQTKKGENIISSIISLAQDLNLKTVAEGVETGAQYEMLKRCGCDTIQGFYFSKPLPESEFDKLVDVSNHTSNRTN